MSARSLSYLIRQPHSGIAAARKTGALTDRYGLGANRHLFSRYPAILKNVPSVVSDFVQILLTVQSVHAWRMAESCPSRNRKNGILDWLMKDDVVVSVRPECVNTRDDFCIRA